MTSNFLSTPLSQIPFPFFNILSKIVIATFYGNLYTITSFLNTLLKPDACLSSQPFHCRLVSLCFSQVILVFISSSSITYTKLLDVIHGFQARSIHIRYPTSKLLTIITNF
jgi:hypothetical protein